MIKLDADEVRVMHDVGRQFPKFVEILNRWRTTELETLPFAKNENLDVMRGRIQSLAELQKAIKP